jgi:hypothetical protein
MNTKNNWKSDSRNNPVEVMNALARMDRKTCDLFRNELDRLAGLTVSSGYDIEYLEIMVEDLIKLVGVLRQDNDRAAVGIVAPQPRRQSWAEGRYAAAVERNGKFSDQGDDFIPFMNPNKD